MSEHHYTKGQPYADDVVLAKIKPEAWDENKTWSLSDFPDVNIRKIRQPEFGDHELEVYLNQYGESEVVKAIQRLQKYDAVESASKVILTWTAW